MTGRWPRCRSSRFTIALVSTLVTFGGLTFSYAAFAGDVLATVNGSRITQADLQLEAILRRVPEDELEKRRELLLDELIDQRLIETSLAKRRVKADPVRLDAQQERLEAFIRRKGEEPEALYERLGITTEQVRERLSLSLAWDEYVREVTSDRSLREYFDQHRRELDGTELQAAHIILKVPKDDAAGRNAARERLAKLRQQIVDGTLTFQAAAAEYSQGPSASDGGGVGYFPSRGKMPAEFCDAAFGLQVREVSQPVETPFGVHLITVTDERGGQLSLEDARPQILQRISKQLWDEQVADGRRSGKITRGD